MTRRYTAFPLTTPQSLFPKAVLHVPPVPIYYRRASTQNLAISSKELLFWARTF